MLRLTTGDIGLPGQQTPELIHENKAADSREAVQVQISLNVGVWTVPPIKIANTS
jgi:hypothetical protein